MRSQIARERRCDCLIPRRACRTSSKHRLRRHAEPSLAGSQRTKDPRRRGRRPPSSPALLRVRRPQPSTCSSFELLDVYVRRLFHGMGHFWIRMANTKTRKTKSVNCVDKYPSIAATNAAVPTSSAKKLLICVIVLRTSAYAVAALRIRSAPGTTSSTSTPSGCLEIQTEIHPGSIRMERSRDRNQRSDGTRQTNPCERRDHLPVSWRRMGQLAANGSDQVMEDRGYKQWNPKHLAQARPVQDPSPRFATREEACRDQLVQSTGS
mmetsp:Transcript_9704/g.58841  ORF Transcript_9704/g.58841 Transcript_9704/m.58841 type:complete len:265 (+) Transcript_9704:165-959(+)